MQAVTPQVRPTKRVTHVFSSALLQTVPLLTGKVSEEIIGRFVRLTCPCCDERDMEVTNASPLIDAPLQGSEEGAKNYIANTFTFKCPRCGQEAEGVVCFTWD